MKKYIIFSAIAIILVASGFYVNHKITISKFNEKLQKTILKDQGLTETILKIEKESSSISYRELFELCDKSVKDRTDIIVDLRGLSSEIESSLKDSLIEFFNAENELIRSKSQAYRKSMSLSSDLKYYKEEEARWIKADLYVKDIYRSTMRSKLHEILEEATGLKENVQTFINQFNLLTKMEDEIDKLMKSEDLKFNPIFKKYSSANISFMNENIQLADFIINTYKADDEYMQLNW